jgi:HTH-type transcriptional regulator/antitoxin HigA
MNNIRVIRDEKDYERAPREIDKNFDHVPVPGSEDAERFDALAALLKEYEDREFAIF